MRRRLGFRAGVSTTIVMDTPGGFRLHPRFTRTCDPTPYPACYSANFLRRPQLEPRLYLGGHQRFHKADIEVHRAGRWLCIPVLPPATILTQIDPQVLPLTPILPQDLSPIMPGNLGFCSRLPGTCIQSDRVISRLRKVEGLGTLPRNPGWHLVNPEATATSRNGRAGNGLQRTPAARLQVGFETNKRPENPRLNRGLVRARPAQCRRTVGTNHHQRHPSVMRLHNRR